MRDRYKDLIDDGFYSIERKLGNSFSKIKKDIDSIKDEVSRAKPSHKEDPSISSELKEISSAINDLKSNLVKREDLDEIKDSVENELAIIRADIDQRIPKKESKRDIKEEVKRELEQDFSERLANVERIALAKSEEDSKIIRNFQKQLTILRERLNDINYEKQEEASKIDELKKELPKKVKKRSGLEYFIIFLAIIIPLAFIGFVAYQNFIASHDFNYFYDIGGNQDAVKPYLTPLNRVSDIMNESDTLNYRNLTSLFVYFNVPVPTGSDNITIDFRFLNNFPDKSSISLQAQFAQDWNYTYNPVFNSSSTAFAKKGEWITESTRFNLKDLYINNGKLSLLFKTPHLADNMTNTMYIPIDWINITVHKDGLL